MKGKKLLSDSIHPPSEIVLFVCTRKKNQPQISPMICEKRCKRIKNCPDYRRYIQPGLFDWLEKSQKAK